MPEGMVFMNDEFKFLIVNTKSKWKKGYNKNLAFLDEGIALKTRPSHIKEWKIDKSKGLREATDIAVDDNGILYILDAENHCILTQDPSNQESRILRCLGNKGSLPGQFNNPGGIAISSDTLYVADTGNNRIQAFAKINWQLKRIIGTDDENNPIIKENSEFKPWKITVYNGFIYVLDNEKHVISVLDEGGRFKGNLKPTEIPEILDIAIDKQGYFYILGKDKIIEFGINKEGIPVKQNSNLLKLGDLTIEPYALAIDSKGNIYVGSGKSEAKRENIFIYKYSKDGTYKGPLLKYNGTCSRIIMDKMDNLYVLNDKNDEIAFLRFTEERYSIKKSGKSIISFQGNENNQKWHKIVLDAVIPKRTQIDVFYYAANEKINGKDISEWIKLCTFQASKPTYGTVSLNDLHDALIKEGSGRYLYIRLELVSSDEYKTPVIRNIKAVFPRISYLRYLPAVYQEDESSRDFLERFLSLFETFIWNTEEEIAQIARYFDAKATPREFLSWLASWLAAVPDENWPEDKIREFLERAIDLYKKRGTREGIEEMIALFTGIKPIIVESMVEIIDNEPAQVEYWQLYKNDKSGNLKLIGEKGKYFKNTVKPFGGPKPYNFYVLLNPAQEEVIIRKSLKKINFDKIEDNLLRAIKRMVKLEKPAHTTAGVSILQQRINLDLHTYLGINSYLSEPIRPMRVGITSIVGGKPLLDNEDAGMIEKSSKLEIDTKLK